MIVHSNGVASLYAHIRDGGFIGTFPRTVGQGEAIALAGNTGLTGAAPPVHLHFALRQGITADPPGLFDGSALRPEPPEVIASTAPPNIARKPTTLSTGTFATHSECTATPTISRTRPIKNRLNPWNLRRLLGRPSRPPRTVDANLGS